jgi:hypothetical protein
MRGVQKGSLLAQLAMGSKTQTNEANPQKYECRWLGNRCILLYRSKANGPGG